MPQKAKWHLLEPGAYTLTECAETIGISRQSLLHYTSRKPDGTPGRIAPPYVEFVREGNEVRFVRVFRLPYPVWIRRQKELGLPLRRPKRRETRIADERPA